MRISDWSSDVCSSDLVPGLGHTVVRIDRHGGAVAGGVVAPVVVGVGEDGAGTVGAVGHVGGVAAAAHRVAQLEAAVAAARGAAGDVAEIGSGSCRDRVCQYEKISVVAVY